MASATIKMSLHYALYLSKEEAAELKAFLQNPIDGFPEKVQQSIWHALNEAEKHPYESAD